MEVYTYSEARQKLATVLDQAELAGKVLIRRKDGRVFSVTPERPSTSPLDVPSLDAAIGAAELVALVRRGRSRTRAGLRKRLAKRRAPRPREAT